jgi:hypothetical protein
MGTAPLGYVNKITEGKKNSLHPMILKHRF